MRPIFRPFLLALALVLGAGAIAIAADTPPSPPDPVVEALGKLGPWGVAGAAVLTLVVTRVLPLVAPLLTKRAEADAAAEQSHTAFTQQLVTDFRTDLAKKDAAFLAALEKLVGRIHAVELELALLRGERPDTPRPAPPAPASPASVGAGGPLPPSMEAAAHA